MDLRGTEEDMRNLAKRWVLLAVAGLTVLMSAVAPAVANQPAEHFELDVTGDQFDCGDTIYETQGIVRATFHRGESKSGNANFTLALTPKNVIAVDTEDEENVVEIRGALREGGTFNAQQETEQFTSTGKLQFIDRGTGRVDNVNQTFHITTVNGNLKDFDFGTCDQIE